MTDLSPPNFQIQRLNQLSKRQKPQIYSLKQTPELSEGKKRKSGSWKLLLVAVSMATLNTVMPACSSRKERLRTIGPPPVYAPITAECGEIRAHRKDIESLAFSPDGNILASGSDDKTIKLWEVASGKLLRTMGDHSSDVTSVSFSPDGKTLASGSDDKTIKLWEVASGKLLRTMEGHYGVVRSVSFSPDGKTLASGSKDTTIKFWEVASGKLLLERYSGSVYSVSFSPDGKILASGGYDNTIRFWEVASGKLLRVLKGHSSDITSVSFSPDGKILASGGYDNTIRFWDIQKGKFISCLFDPQATPDNQKAIRYEYTNIYGVRVSYTLPCGSPIPPGAICTCNCVPGAYTTTPKYSPTTPKYSPRPSRPSWGGTYCSCDKVCSCVPVYY